MADQPRSTGDASIDAIINDPAYQDAVAVLVDRRVGEIRAHYAELLTDAGHTEAAAFLRDLDE
jgi:hypothetical protein